MGNFLALLSETALQETAVNEIVAYNGLTASYGLTLSVEAATALVVAQRETLSGLGRLEFGGGLLGDLIKAFCSSPYVNQADYADTLAELVTAFYYFKNESLEEISDEDLIDLMRDYFNEQCEGSVQLLLGREMETLAHSCRYGVANYWKINDYDDRWTL